MSLSSLLDFEHSPHSPELPDSPSLLAPEPRALLCAPERLLIGPHYRHISSLIGQSSAGSNPQAFYDTIF